MKKLLLVLMLLGSATASQAEMNGDEIITRANKAAYYAGDDGRAQVEMSIVDKSGEIGRASCRERV